MGRAFEYRRAAKEKRWDKMSRVFPKLAKKITIAAKSAGPDPDLKRFPNDPQEFSEEQMEEIEKMLDKLEEDDDVQAVYTNIA